MTVKKLMWSLQNKSKLYLLNKGANCSNVTLLLFIFILTYTYLATSQSYRSLAFDFWISHCTISTIVKEVDSSICEKLVPVFCLHQQKLILNLGH